MVMQNVRKLAVEAVLVEEDARDLFGADMLLADAAGNPVFLHLAWEEPRLVPFKIMDITTRLKRHAGLFLRAYGDSGITSSDDPLFLFILRGCPSNVLEVVEKIAWARVRLYCAETAMVAGAKGLLIKEVHPDGAAGPSGALFLENGP
jgi:hypothetical protein